MTDKKIKWNSAGFDIHSNLLIDWICPHCSEQHLTHFSFGMQQEHKSDRPLTCKRCKITSFTEQRPSN